MFSDKITQIPPIFNITRLNIVYQHHIYNKSGVIVHLHDLACYKADIYYLLSVPVLELCRYVFHCDMDISEG